MDDVFLVEVVDRKLHIFKELKKLEFYFEMIFFDFRRRGNNKRLKKMEKKLIFKFFSVSEKFRKKKFFFENI